MKKVLVAYFSASGTKKELAENLAHIAEQILDTLQQGVVLVDYNYVNGANWRSVKNQYT